MLTMMPCLEDSSTLTAFWVQIQEAHLHPFTAVLVKSSTPAEQTPHIKLIQQLHELQEDSCFNVVVHRLACENVRETKSLRPGIGSVIK